MKNEFFVFLAILFGMSIEEPIKPSAIEGEKTEGEKKIHEYASRIVGGENPAYVLEGLPESWIQKVNETVDGEMSISLEDVPVQYRGMSGEALEFIWADQNNIPLRLDQSENDRSREINRRKRIVELVLHDERMAEKYVVSPKEKVVPVEPENTPLLEDAEKKKLRGWSASYELAKIAKQQSIDLSKLSREAYAEFAIQNALAIDDSQLRVAPWQRMATSVDEIVKKNKEKQTEIHEEADRAFSKFCFEMQKKAGEEERYLSDGVRVRQGTKDSNSWLFFGINDGVAENSSETFKSYISMKDLNTLTPDRFTQFMVALREANYSGDIKIFQDLSGQGIRLNDQIVMHGGSHKDAILALEVAERFFGDEIDQKSVGKDEVVDGVNKSYSQILAQKITDSIHTQK